MKFHKIKMVGAFNNEQLSTLPTFDTARDQSRLVWLTDGSLWYGDTNRWVKILAGDGGGGTVHNDLAGRSDADCHPISAITGLQDALQYAGMRWEIRSSSFVAEDHVGYLVDTSSGTVNVTLPDLTGMAPSATLGLVVQVVDMAGTFDANSAIVSGNGQLIMGESDPVEMGSKWGSATFVYSDTTHGWIVADGKVGGCSGATSRSLEWSVINTSLTAQSYNGYFVDTEANQVTLTLPASPQQGDIIRVIDYNGFANTNPITINPNGLNINGQTSNLVLDVNRTSVFLVYSDLLQGWEIFDSNKSNTNEITVPTTIYLAPSASAQSPTGIVGSDITGDGSYNKPFFSIKRAMEYLENYSIKPGVIVTIQGLPGKYYYNDDHSVEMKHKDVKYINIKFDMVNTSYLLTTDVTNDAISIINNTDHDLITFSVSDIGSGYSQIQAGDFVKLHSNDRTIESIAAWHGFYEVYSVDIVNKKVTIIFKRHQINGSYNPNHQYLLPNTLSNTGDVSLIKYSSHIYINSSTGVNGYFLYSEYGLGVLQISASCVNYYSIGFLYVYDGVVNDVITILNGFSKGLTLFNLLFKFYYSDWRLSTVITSCSVGIKSKDSVIYGDYVCMNNCYSGYVLDTTSLYADIINPPTVCFINMYNSPLVMSGSIYTYCQDGARSRVSNFSYSYTGISCSVGSILKSYGINISNNAIGLSLDDSKAGFYVLNPSATSALSYVWNNNIRGISMTDRSELDISYLDVQNNSGYGIIMTSSVINVTNIGYSSRYNISNNGSVGVHATNSNIYLRYTSVSNNTNNGITLYSSTYISDDVVHNYNGASGVAGTNKSNITSLDTSFYGNSSYGLYVANETVAYVNNNGSTKNISNNTTSDMYAYAGGKITCIATNPPVNTNPAKNTSPSYDYQNSLFAGSYILIRDV